MKYIYILLTMFFLSSCKMDKTANSIIANIERIVISDNKNSMGIYYIISIENKCNEDITLSTNSVKNEAYFQHGLILKRDNFVTPIGGFYQKIIK